MSSPPSSQSVAVYCHYRTVAQRFLELSQTRAICVSDIEPWRQGRERYWCWCIEIDDALVLERIERYQRRLADRVVADYQRQPHLTLAVCGFWQAEPMADNQNDDFFEHDLQDQLSRLAQLPQSAVTLTVLGANSFASAPFLEVVDQSPQRALHQLRECLLPRECDFRTTDYCPHITLGLFHRSLNISPLHFLLTDPRDREPLTFEVSALSLMSYDGADLKGSLRLERRVSLLS